LEDGFSHSGGVVAQTDFPAGADAAAHAAVQAPDRAGNRRTQRNSGFAAAGIYTRDFRTGVHRREHRVGAALAVGKENGVVVGASIVAGGQQARRRIERAAAATEQRPGAQV
jgi:hypothetical protein